MIDELVNDEAFDEPIPAATLSEERKAQDLKLFHQWKSSGSKQDLGKLMQHLSPLMYKEVSRVSGSLPVTALNAEAKKWAIKAIQSYDPNRGVALATHVMNYLPKVRRLNYKYQNVARLPENKQLQFHQFNRAQAQLSDELNRDPSEEEMAAHLGWSKGQVVNFKKLLYADLIESSSEQAAEFVQFSDQPILMKHLMEQLTPEEKTILTLNKELSSQELANKLSVNVARLNYLKRKLTDKIIKLQRELGI